MTDRRTFLFASAAALLGRRAGSAVPDLPTAAAAVGLALADAERLGAAALTTRYLSAHHVADRDELAELYAVTALHVNGISRKGFVARPRKVAAWLWAIDLDDYGIDPVVYANAFRGGSPLSTEPYFHDYLTDGKVKTPAVARWVPAADGLRLATLTGSPAFASIARADWWLHRTWDDAGRDGFGYTSLLGLKSRADVDTLAGLNRGIQAEKFTERLAVVRRSGVAVNPSRQVVRLQAATGPVWFTKDVRADTLGVGDKSATRLRFEDYRHDAEEGVATLPNGLPLFWLSDDKGAFVASAPDDIASNNKATGNDARVHVGHTCWACHTHAGLIPFDDLERRPGRLPSQSADRALYDRTRSAYFRELRDLFDADSARFGKAVKEACGLAPEAVPPAVRRQWSRYADRPVTAEMAAAEVGLTPAEFAKRLSAYAAANPNLLDPVLSEYLQADPDPPTRFEFEEMFPAMMAALGYPGGVP